uniref:ATPase 8 n=1 Tax=Terrisswalkerius millamilla TaxID=169900 RepID=Q94VQ3_9ANNE|nr:ATPase 8 [Terrisswalkerius millamilla]
MPHLSPMSWLLAATTFWTTMMLFTSNMWWSNNHMFKTGDNPLKTSKLMTWEWFLQGGWE